MRNLFLDGEGPAKPQAEVRPLVRMVEQVDADILVLQEVGSAASLAQLNARLTAPYPVCELREGNSNRSIHLGVLARYPLSVTSFRDISLTDACGAALHHYRDEADARAGKPSPLRFQRDLLLVEVAAGGARLALFCVHLKSRTNPAWQMLSADEVRSAECRALSAVVTDYRARHPRAAVLLLGDFNDRLSSAALAALDSLAFADPLGDQLRDSGRNPSTYWPKRRMRIDHVLVSPNARAAVVSGSPTIHVNHMARTASDHYPVSLALSLALSPPDLVNCGMHE